MPVDLGPRLGILINASSSEAYTDQFRPFLRFIDALLLGRVLNSTTTAPPSSPANGDAYLLLGVPTGAWTGNANAVAVWSTEITLPGTNTKVPGWDIWTPNEGWVVWDATLFTEWRFTAGAWTEEGGGGGGGGVPSVNAGTGNIVISGGPGITVTAAGPAITVTGLTIQQVALTPGSGGNFTKAHGLGVEPEAVIVTMTSGGQIWLQNGTMFDSTNLYLVASDAGITGFALCFMAS